MRGELYWLEYNFQPEIKDYHIIHIIGLSHLLSYQDYFLDRNPTR
jgi:hypothetical protein